MRGGKGEEERRRKREHTTSLRLMATAALRRIGLPVSKCRKPLSVANAPGCGIALGVKSKDKT